MSKSWKIIPQKSHLKFSVNNAGFAVPGSFGEVKAQINFDTNNLKDAMITGIVQSKSINTANFLRDTHLRLADYFYADKYPQIEFKSQDIKETKGAYLAQGELFIKGKTYDFEIPFTASAEESFLVLNGNLKVNRLDYNIGPRSFILANQVKIDYSLYFRRRIITKNMLVEFDQMPVHARTWVYQADRDLNPQEIKEVALNLDRFIQEWTAHSAELRGSFKVFHNRFLVITVDESHHGASGCSIDASVHFIQKLGDAFGVDFFDRKVIFQKEDQLVAEPVSKLKSLIQEGVIQTDTPVFNNSVSSLEAFQNEWQKKTCF